MPIFDVVRCQKDPTDQRNRIVKTEYALGVLNVVLIEQGIKLIGIIVVCKVYCAPLESLMKGLSLSLYIFDLLLF